MLTHLSMFFAPQKKTFVGLVKNMRGGGVERKEERQAWASLEKEGVRISSNPVH